MLVLDGKTVMLCWPPSGIALAALLLFGRRLWPGIFIGLLCVGLSSDLPFIASAGIALGSTAAALLGATLLSRTSGFNRYLRTVQDVLHLLLFGALVSTVLCAANASFWLSAQHIIPWERYGHNFLFSWMSDALGAVLFAPAVIAFFRKDELEWTAAMRRSAGLLGGALLSLCLLIYTDLGKNLLGYQFKSFTILPVIVWAAVGFNFPVACLTLLVVYGFALVSITAGVGRFNTITQADVFDVWLYNIIIGVIGLCLVMVREQRRRAHNDLKLSERNFKRAQQVVSMGSWYLDLRKNQLSGSDEVYSILGIPPGVRLFYPSLLNYVHPDERKLVDATWQAALRGQAFDIEHRIIVDGQIKWIRENAEIDLDRSGRPATIFGTVRDVTRRKLTEQALASESEKNKMLLRAASDGIHIIDAECNIVQMSDSFCAMLGYTREQMLTMNLSDFDAKWPLDVLKQRIGSFLLQGESAVFDTKHRHRDGHIIDVEISIVRVEIDGKHYMYASARDITQRKLTEESLRLSAKVFEGSADAILISDADNHILTVNKAFTLMTGYTAEEVRGKNPNMLSSGQHDRIFYQHMWDALNRDFRWEGEIYDRRKDGEIYAKQMSIDMLRDELGKPTHYIAISKDITERMVAEQKIHALAYYDVLTGLPNRTLMHDRLAQMLAVAHRDKQKVGVMFIDLDRFKYVNDSLGHLMGDKLLQAVAQQLLACVRDGDTVSRIGGDEFVILLRETDPEGAAHVAAKLLEVLSLPYNIEDVQIPTHASIGISIYPDSAQDIDALLKSADVAMYRAKDEGRNNFQFYTAEMNFRAQHLFSMEKDLNLALERNEFSLHYQPVVDLLSGTICGVETLLRWNHPDRGYIGPTEFIPVAEETGQILPVGAWVLRTACAQLAAWRQQGLPVFPIAVNLSIRQLRQANLAQLVRTVLEQNALSPGDLDLELTEGIMMADTETAMMFLTQMHELGVRLSIDDFGTGYSSLSYLKKLPVHKLKIDQSFVRDIVIDENDAAIASSIITLGHQFNLRVVAEGAETREQVEFLRVRGCDEIQGYYYCHPLPADEFAQFVREHPLLA